MQRKQHRKDANRVSVGGVHQQLQLRRLEVKTDVVIQLIIFTIVVVVVVVVIVKSVRAADYVNLQSIHQPDRG